MYGFTPNLLQKAAAYSITLGFLIGIVTAYLMGYYATEPSLPITSFVWYHIRSILCAIIGYVVMVYLIHQVVFDYRVLALGALQLCRLLALVLVLYVFAAATYHNDHEAYLADLDTAVCFY